MGTFIPGENVELKSANQTRVPRQLRRHSQILQDRHGKWCMGLPAYVTDPGHEIPTLLAVGGGKGGVGKSILSANLSARLAGLGYRVLVIDLDLGCANLHTHFGIPKPKYTLANMVLESSKTFAEIITPTTVPGVALVAGGQEASWSRHLARGPETLLTLWDAIFSAKRRLHVDFVVMDLGAGTARHTMDFYATAHLGVLTALPEPTSIENAYVFLKTHLWNLIDHVAVRSGEEGSSSDIRTVLRDVGKNPYSKGYSDAFRQLSASYPNFVSNLLQALSGRDVGIVINQTRSQSDIDIGPAMEMICKRYFGVHAGFLGDLNYDDSAWKSLRNRRLLLNDFPHAILSKRLSGVTASILKVLGHQE